MFFSIKSIEMLVAILTVTFVYIISVSVVGYVRAFVAKKLGDTLPEELGFLTLSPFAHVSLFWLFCLIFFQLFDPRDLIALGRYIPLSVEAFTGKWRRSKMVLAHLSDVIASFFIAFFFLLFIFIVYQNKTLFLLYHPFSFKHVVAVLGNNVEPSFLVLTYGALVMFIFNCVLTAVSFFVNCYTMISSYMAMQWGISFSSELVKIIAFIMLWILLLPLLVYHVQFFILKMVTLISYKLGFVKI